MGGHGVHTTPNMKNHKESDEDMQNKIQQIELIKYNPNMFHLDCTDPVTVFNVIGGVPTAACGVVGSLLSYGYYASQARTFNMYTNITRTQGRLVFGLFLGLAFGYNRFGDRQKVHNAFVAETLRMRYPESMDLHQTDLWRFKGVQAPHTFYRWA